MLDPLIPIERKMLDEKLVSPALRVAAHSSEKGYIRGANETFSEIVRKINEQLLTGNLTTQDIDRILQEVREQIVRANNEMEERIPDYIKDFSIIHPESKEEIEATFIVNRLSGEYGKNT